MTFHSRFPLAPLGDVARFINGDRSSNYPKGVDYVTTGIPFISAADLGDGEVDFASARQISATAYERLRSGKIQRDDALFCLRGSIGKIAYIKESQVGAIASSLVIIRASELIDPRYLFFGLSSRAGQQAAAGLNNGAAQPNLSVGELQKIEIPLPSMPFQHRIAGILSAYDDLIENNQRRIKILEEMARRLYREWFVHFRFPGHEDCRFVESPLGEIPEGWEVKRLDEVCRSIEDGDWIETKDQGGKDYRLLQISNVGVREFIETGKFRCITQETFSRLRCNEIVPGDLLVARMPTPIGRGWLATKMPWRMITAVDVAIIRADPMLLDPLFLAQAWNEHSNLNRIAAQASGTTRLRITRRELAAMEFVIPPISVQKKFAEVAEPQSGMIKTLQEKIQNLRRTRDLLLPRLLSGQIEVEALPEPVLSEA